MKKIFSIYCLVAMTLLLAACSQDTDNNNGYLTLKVNTLVSTHTPGTRTDAPSGYAPKQLHVDIVNAQGQTVMSTNDFNNDATFNAPIQLPADSYTIHVYSNGWDGSGSGFDVPYYYGSTLVDVPAGTVCTAKVTCTLANVKVTVEYDQSFIDNFASARSTVSSRLSGVNPLTFTMGQTTQSGYFPVGDLSTLLEVTNKGGESHTMSKDITSVKARDHYILKYKVADHGSLGDGTNGGITVTVDESTNTYTYEFQVPTKSGTAFTLRGTNAWSSFAYLNAVIDAKTSDFDQAGLSLQWKKASDADWTSVAASALTIDSEDNISYKLTGLTPATAYEYRLHYVKGDDEVNSDVATFTTEAQTALYNSGFENWNLDNKAWYPNESGVTYWSTSNPGSTLMGEKWNVTTSITDGAYSGTSAQLKSTYVVIKFAAASMYTGSFQKLIGTNGAELNWGVPFTSRPTSLKGYMKYTTGAINRGNQPSGIGAAAKGENDACQIFCALLSEELKVANASNEDGYELSTAINWQTDPRVIAYGELTQNTTDAAWKPFEVPLTYHSLTQKPTHLLIVCTSSKWGDYFYGCDTATLLLDDFTMEYGDNPTAE